MINGGPSLSSTSNSRRQVTPRSERHVAPLASEWPLSNVPVATSSPQSPAYPRQASRNTEQPLTYSPQTPPYHPSPSKQTSTERARHEQYYQYPTKPQPYRERQTQTPYRDEGHAPPPPKLAEYQSLVTEPFGRSKSMKVKPMRSSPAFHEDFVFPRSNDENIQSNKTVQRPPLTRGRSASASSVNAKRAEGPLNSELRDTSGMSINGDLSTRTPQDERYTRGKWRGPPQNTMPSSYTQGGPPDSMRASVRSGFTTGSSTADMSSTERSSTITDRSSASDLTKKTSWSKIREQSPGGDSDYVDLIAMYGEGFVSDSGEDAGRTLPTSPLSNQQEIRPKTADEKSRNLKPSTSTVVPRQLATKPPFATSHARSSTQIIAGQLDFSQFRDEPSKSLETEYRDRYGFKKQSQHVSIAKYDAWNSSYKNYLARRRQKWIVFMKQSVLAQANPKEFPPRSDKVKRYVRKGIPPDWRGAAWWWYAGGPEQLAKNRGLYDQLVERSEKGQISDGDKEHIERDLHRTFPDNIKFKPDPNPIDLRHANPPRPSSSSSIQSTTQETPMIQSLRRVLRAFAVYNPKIGYCQSLNFLAGMLLLFLHGDEEKSFHMLLIITTVHLPGTHGVALEGANVDIGVLMTALKEKIPAVWAKLDDRVDASVKVSRGDMRMAAGLPTVSLATTAWFMSAFVSTLPIETTARVWDVLFYEGSKTLFRVALAVFKLGERAIRTATDPMEVFQVVQTLPRGLIDANEVMEVALRKGRGGVGGLSQKTVEKRREERRGLYKAEREKMLSMQPQPSGGGEGEGLGRKLSRSSSRARLKRMVSMRSTREVPKVAGSGEKRPA